MLLTTDVAPKPSSAAEVAAAAAVSVAEAATAAAPSVVPIIIRGEEEAARVAAADAVGIVASSVASGGIPGKRGVGLPPVPVSWWGAAVRGEPAPRGDALAEERGRPFKTEVVCTL